MPLRPIAAGDADELAAVLTRNRAFLDPWEPVRDDRYFTPEGQRERIEAALLTRERDLGYAFVITGAAGSIQGALNINNVVRGAGQFASLGYWVAEEANGQGHATRAVAEAVAIGFGALNLHRLEAGALVHNIGSQRVLERNGFTRYGLAPELVHIAGRWQDHVLLQRLNPDWAPRVS